jgi:aminoglycoside 3-N-acetyltransferase
MRPEPKSQSEQVHSSDVAQALHSVGVVRGDIVMFHSSLSSMGHVVGGPNTVIEGFLEAVGPEGTVCVPTLWYHHTEPPMDLSLWDRDNSPSYPGLITETFRQRSDSLRSDNPTHSISAIGSRAAELTGTHGQSGLRPCRFGDGAFAADSPWERLYQWNAAYCFIGVDFTVNTMGHYIECRFMERALQQAPASIRDELEDELIRWQKPGVYASYSFQKMGERLAEMALVRFGTIGSATLRCIRARDMVDNILAILDREPEKWFQDDFLQWLERARRAAQS